MSYLRFIDYGKSEWPLGVISFHGFPGIRSKQNREIAEGISNHLSRRARVVLYPGLSAEGEFSFTKTIDALINEFPALVEEKKIDVLGHSFGGFNSLLMASKYPEFINRLALLSPLLKFASTVPQAISFFKNIVTVNSGINTRSAEDLGHEFQQLSLKYKVEDIIANIDPKIKIEMLQARNDQITPTAVAEEFQKYFKGDFKFKLVDQDHSFLTDRPELAKEIANFFKQ